MDLGEPRSAAESFARAAQLEPKVVDHWVNLATAWRQAGQLGHSAAAYERAVGLSPNDADLWRDLGTVRLEAYRAGGDDAVLAQALDAWRTSLRLKPDQPDVARWLQVYATSQPASRPTTRP